MCFCYYTTIDIICQVNFYFHFHFNSFMLNSLIIVFYGKWCDYQTQKCDSVSFFVHGLEYSVCFFMRHCNNSPSRFIIAALCSNIECAYRFSVTVGFLCPKIQITFSRPFHILKLSSRTYAVKNEILYALYSIDLKLFQKSFDKIEQGYHVRVYRLLYNSR